MVVNTLPQGDPTTMPEQGDSSPCARLLVWHRDHGDACVGKDVDPPAGGMPAQHAVAPVRYEPPCRDAVGEATNSDSEIRRLGQAAGQPVMAEHDVGAMVPRDLRATINGMPCDE